ncbi:class I SAM-dependent methyltransferase [bacterium]|nr:class I SAM-dependent methyltransferase [bacterium]
MVGGGRKEAKRLNTWGFTDFTVTNLDTQDAENLTYDNDAFDYAICHAVLHHCYSPHRAMLEMYRVSKKGIVMFEARDSLLMRLAVSLGLPEEYERSAINGDHGGVRNSSIPNFVYRWTEREIIKTIATYDPIREPDIRFFHGFNSSMYWLADLTRQGNQLAWCASKNGRVHEWIKPQDNPRT